MKQYDGVLSRIAHVEKVDLNEVSFCAPNQYMTVLICANSQIIFWVIPDRTFSSASRMSMTY